MARWGRVWLSLSGTKAFLKAGVLTELGENRQTYTGTPQGGILSPLLASIALSVLDEHVHRPWEPGGSQATSGQRSRRRSKDLPNWRIVRYADDFVVLVHGNRDDVEALREDVANVLAPLGLRFSAAKTQIVHMSDGFDFLGFHIQWRRKYGTNVWHVYTFIADRPIRSLKAKIRALTKRTSQQDRVRADPAQPDHARLGQLLQARGLQAHLGNVAHFAWWRVVRWPRTLHRWKWTAVRRRFTTPDGRWRPITADGIELFNLEAVPVTRYRWRGNTIPTPWTLPDHA